MKSLLEGMMNGFLNLATGFFKKSMIWSGNCYLITVVNVVVRVMVFEKGLQCSRFLLHCMKKWSFWADHSTGRWEWDGSGSVFMEPAHISHLTLLDKNTSWLNEILLPSFLHSFGNPIIFFLFERFTRDLILRLWKYFLP